jgi:hypothetical protein
VPSWANSAVGRRLAVVVSDNQDVLILTVDVLLRLAHSADCVDAAYVLFEPEPGPRVSALSGLAEYPNKRNKSSVNAATGRLRGGGSRGRTRR